MTLPATISPLKSDTTIASATDSVAAADPGAANTVARERPTLTTDPSAGYSNDCTSAVVVVGHSSPPTETVLLAGNRDAHELRARTRRRAPRRRCGCGEGRRGDQHRRRSRRRSGSWRFRVARGLPARSPDELSGDREQENREQPTEDVLRKRRGEPCADLDADDRRDTDHERDARSEVAVAPLAPHAGEHGRQDREERGALRLELAEAERDERGDEEDPSADAEEPGRTPAATPRTTATRIVVVLIQRGARRRGPSAARRSRRSACSSGSVAAG